MRKLSNHFSAFAAVLFSTAALSQGHEIEIFDPYLNQDMSTYPYVYALETLNDICEDSYEDYLDEICYDIRKSISESIDICFDPRQEIEQYFNACQANAAMNLNENIIEAFNSRLLNTGDQCEFDKNYICYAIEHRGLTNVFAFPKM